MGSWSVYCGVSQISITDGKKCALLPLKKTDDGEYLPYLPATLPIFGTYGDYGNIENIEENDNTKLIEEYFNCGIDEFCNFLTSDGDDEIEDVKNEKELKKIKYMFIDRQVYDFMSSHVGDEYQGKGSLDFGNKGILKLLGFEYVGENNKNPTNDPKRYNHEWKFGNERFYSDGQWLMHKNGSVYYFNKLNEYSKENSLSKYITIPEDKMWVGEKAMWQLWKYLDKDMRFKKLSWIMDIEYSSYTFEKMLSKFGKEPGDEKFIKPRRIAHKYLDDIDKFGDGLAELVTMRHNLRCMSGYFAPYILYLTPQCGEFEHHQILLEKFTEINKGYAREGEE